MNEIISLAIPHIGEEIFKNCSDKDLIEFRHVSTTWKEMAENILVKRWRDRLIETTCSCSLCANEEEGHFICPSTFNNLCLQPNEVIQMLLEHPGGNDINWNATTPAGNSIVMFACYYRCMDAVKIILKSAQNKNIDLNARNVVEGTVFQYLCKAGQADLVELLLDHSNSFDVKAKTKFPKDEFMLACALGHANVVEMLLKYAPIKDIDLSDGNWEETTPFMAACIEGHADVVKLLLSQNNYIGFNYVDFDRKTAFLYACMNGHIEVVKHILQACRTKRIFLGSDQRKRGLKMACQNGHTKIVTLLKRHEKRIMAKESHLCDKKFTRKSSKKVAEDCVISANRRSKRQKR